MAKEMMWLRKLKRVGTTGFVMKVSLLTGLRESGRFWMELQIDLFLTTIVYGLKITVLHQAILFYDDVMFEPLDEYRRVELYFGISIND